MVNVNEVQETQFGNSVHEGDGFQVGGSKKKRKKKRKAEVEKECNTEARRLRNRGNTNVEI